MKFLRSVALGLATAAALLSGIAHAQTSPATSTFNVNLTLTPVCYVNITATPGNGTTSDVTMTYTAFQTAHAESSTGFTVTCTTGLGYDIAVTNDTETIAGIDYYLRLASGTTAQYTSAAGAASLSALSGSGAAQSYTIGVRAPGGQVGDCTVSCTDSKTHTITVSY